jgi:ABC-type multidrug transport system fused ATPase/permease subunit
MISEINKIKFLLSKRQKKRILILTFLLFVGMILEVFGLGILIPALTILLDSEKAFDIQFIRNISILIPGIEKKHIIYLILLAIAILYFLKTLFLVFLNYVQNKFLSNLIATITNKLFSSYLNQPYDFHLKNNVSRLIKNLQIETNHLKSFILSLITLITEGGFVISILFTIIYIEPIGAISIGVFYGFLSAIFFQFTKRKLLSWGNLRQNLDNQTSKISLEGIGGIKDLIILDKLDFFLNNFSQKNYLKARLNANQSTISQVPRFYLELISIIGLVSFISLLLIQGKEISALISILGVFVAATFRMIPSLNRIISSLQIMKYHKPSVDIIYSEINSFFNTQIIKKEPNNCFSFKNKIEFINTSFNYNKNNKVLNKINITINKGQIVGFIGESGSGKSTLVDLLIGLFKPSEGEIVIDGQKDINQTQAWRNQIGYVSQSIYLLDDTIINNIALGVSSIDIDLERINQVIEQCQLKEFVASLDKGIETNVGERGVQISGGQKQRIGIARALYRNPTILILDEATSALDYDTEKQIINSVVKNKGDKTLIMIAHRLNTLEECDFIYDLNKKI